jgi:tetratricopeptide (TPR) repeat protein
MDFVSHIVSARMPETYAGPGPVHTDDNALLEYAAPRTLYRTDLVMQVVAGINQYRAITSADWAEPPAPAGVDLRIRATTCVEARRLAVDALLAWRRADHTISFELARKASTLDASGSAILIPHAAGLLRNAEQAMQRGDLASAERLADAACRLAPAWSQGRSRLGVMWVNAGRWREAIDAYRRAVELSPTDWSAANNLAWLLAVVPDSAVRNGKEAAAISERLCRMTDHKQPVFLRTFAAAHAELGHFEEATRQAKEAFRQAGVAQDGSLLEQIRVQISCYQTGKSFRLRASR